MGCTWALAETIRLFAGPSYRDARLPFVSRVPPKLPAHQATVRPEPIQDNRLLINILEAHPEISKHVKRSQLEAFCDPGKNLGKTGVMVVRGCR